MIGCSDFAALFQYWLDRPGLLAHWALDETAGQMAEESQGLTPGTVHGDAQWQPHAGQINGALAFDGVDDYVETDFVLDPGVGPFSVLLWARGGQAGEVLLSQASGRTWIGMDPLTGTLMSQITDGGRRTQALVSDTVLTDERWYEIALVWDGTYRHLFIDGVEVAVDSRALANLSGSRGGLHFGAAAGLDAGAFWTGLIDEIRIYDRALLVDMSTTP
jgi:hypothetical protein